MIRFSKTKIQAFLEARNPLQQFAFRFKFLWAMDYDGEKIGSEEISNKKTGEKLSIVCAYIDFRCIISITNRC